MTLGAQANRETMLLFEPGVMTLNAASAPLSTGSSTGLNLRFLAVIPTSIPWLSAEIGMSFAPLGLSNGQRAFNEPTFFYGPLYAPAARQNAELAGALSAGAGRVPTRRLWGRGSTVCQRLRRSGACGLIGQKLMGDMGSFWSRLTVYAIVEQNLTPSRNPTTQKVDRLNPTFLYGISIPIRGPKNRGSTP